MNIDKNYWRQELPPPYSPSIEDVKIFKSFISGTVLLLGCTHKLLELTDAIMDIDPWYDDKRVIIRWLGF